MLFHSPGLIYISIKTNKIILYKATVHLGRRGTGAPLPSPSLRRSASLRPEKTLSGLRFSTRQNKGTRSVFTELCIIKLFVCLFGIKCLSGASRRGAGGAGDSGSGGTQASSVRQHAGSNVIVSEILPMETTTRSPLSVSRRGLAGILFQSHFSSSLQDSFY